MGTVLVVSGPSGSGKTSLARRIVDECKDSYFSISTTTRVPRVGEQDGVDYFFVDKNVFLQQIENGLFLEWAEVHGNFYGTSLEPINEALSQDKLVVFDVDVQGHKLIRKKFGEAITSIFITTPNLDILKLRLQNRESESKGEMQERIINALDEMNSIDDYDYLLINDDFESSLRSLRSIAHSARFKRTKINIQAFLQAWKNS